MKFFENLFKKKPNIKKDKNAAEPTPQQGDGHPIPSELIERIDIITTTNDGKGVSLIIISSGYLDDSEYTEQRIIGKITNYLKIINSADFINDFGEPSSDRTSIKLRCSTEPHPSVYELIESLEEQVNLYNSSLAIEV